jgi:membrane-bound ClpP family serine protease
MPLTPDTAFVLTIFGLFGLYAELVWPTRSVAGFLGLGAVLAGVYTLWLHAPTLVGVELVTAAALLFAIDAVAGSFLLAGSAATVAMILGFWKLFAHSPTIALGLIIPLCLAFGAVTVFLSHVTRQARRNKAERSAWNF